jgi:hypothetical protein
MGAIGKDTPLTGTIGDNRVNIPEESFFPWFQPRFAT